VSARKRPDRSKADTALALSEHELSDQTVRGLIDDWIVPALVERFLSSKKSLSEATQERHNQDQ